MLVVDKTGVGQAITRLWPLRDELTRVASDHLPLCAVMHVDAAWFNERLCSLIRAKRQGIAVRTCVVE